MYNKARDIEYINLLTDHYPKTEDELQLVVLKLLSLPCSKSLDRTQFITLCKIDSSRFNQKQALRSIDQQIQKTEKKLEKVFHPILKKKSENLHTIYNALETCFINYQHHD